MTASIRLLSESGDAQLRRLEPRLYHLVLVARPGREAARALEEAADEDAAPERYALIVEPLAGVRELIASPALYLRRACHVALVSRSPLSTAVARAATAISRLRGGPEIVRYASLEAGFAAARRALRGTALAHPPVFGRA